MQDTKFDMFTRINFVYPHSMASLKVGRGIKSEGEMIISGTKGYLYVPSPWWLTEYFEIRYEDAKNNKRYFYQLEGEGIRYELVDFVKSINAKTESIYISDKVSEEISHVIQMFYDEKNVTTI